MYIERNNLRVWTIQVQENTLDFYVAKMETTSTSHQKVQCNSMIEKLVPRHFLKSALKKVWVINK